MILTLSTLQMELHVLAETHHLIPIMPASCWIAVGLKGCEFNTPNCKI